MERNPWLRALTVILVIAGAWYVIGQVWALAARFSDVILLLFLAWLLAFALAPVARLLRRAGLPRLLSITIVYLGLMLVIFAGIVLLFPVISLQISQLGTVIGTFSDQLPGWIANLQAELVRRNINVDISGFYRQQDVAAQIGQISSLLIQNTLTIVSGVASALIGMFLVLVLSFYIMVDGGRLADQLIGALPPRLRDEPQFLIESVERTFGGFMRGQIIQCVIYGAGTAVVMLALGVNYVLVSSLFAGLMMLVPFVGPVVAILPPVLIALLQGSLTTVVIVAVALLALQQVVINVIAPKVLSEAVGLPPLLVILALLIGGKVAGVVGAIFGVPAAAVLYAMLLFVYHRSSLPEKASTVQHVPRRRGSPSNESGQSNVGWWSKFGQWARRHFISPR